MPAPLFRKQAIEHQQHKLHGDVLILPKLSHAIITGIIVVWLAVLIIWLSTANYARTETVFGWLESSDGVVKIYPQHPFAKIKEVLVKNGDMVIKGQPLMLMDNDKVLDNGEYLSHVLLEEYRSQQDLLAKGLKRRQQIFNIQQEELRHQIKAADHHITGINEQLQTVNKRLEINRNRVKKSAALLQQGHISTLEFESIFEQELMLKSEYQSLIQKKVQLEDQIISLQHKLALMPQEHENNVAQVTQNLGEISLRIAQAKGDNSQTLTAPRDGIVSNLQVKQGQAASTTLPVMSIIPANTQLIAKLLIPVRAAAFIQKGQGLQIRYEAFPYQKFGLHAGSVSNISSAVVLPNEIHGLPIQVQEPVYLVGATLHNNMVTAYGQQFPLKLGMTFSADVKLAERSLLEWLLEPIISLKGHI